MKKLLASILALTLALLLCACAAGDNEPAGTQPQPETRAPEPESEIVYTESMIELSEFCDPEEMPEPFGDEDPIEFSDGTYEILVDVCVYTPDWLYYHNVYDWRAAGITYEQISEIADGVLSLPFTDEALEAFKTKISDFTMIMTLEVPRNINSLGYGITIDDKVYDVAWLTSHNATEYTEAGIPAATVKELLDALHSEFWYTFEYRWIEEVYSRLINGIV